MSEKKTVAQTLRESRKKWEEGLESDLMADSCECTVCEQVLGKRCDSGDCGRWISRLADMVEAEVEEASAARCTAYIDNLARLGRVPGRRLGETLEKWLGRGFLPIPRYPNGEPVSVGSVSEYGTVAMVEVRLTDGGRGNWTLYTEEQEEPVWGTLSERVPRGLLVEGKPAKKGDKLWFGDDEVTVMDVDGLSGTIFTDYLTEDTDGERFPYPFEPFELSWERKEEPDSMERIRADAVKTMALYWGCDEWVCCDCRHEPNPKERYGVVSCLKAMKLDIIRRTEEVCKR